MSTQRLVEDAKRSWRRALYFLAAGAFVFVFSQTIAFLWLEIMGPKSVNQLAAIGVGLRWFGTLLFAAGLIERLVSEIRSLRAELLVSQRD